MVLKQWMPLRERRGSEKLGPKVANLLSILKQSATRRDLVRGKQAHALAIETGDDSNTYVATSLINMYAKCGILEDARKLFDKLPHRDVFTWTSLLSGYADNGQADTALQLLDQMELHSCTPNAHTLAVVLKACSTLAAKEQVRIIRGVLVKPVALEKGMKVHSRATRLDCLDIFLENSLMDMYSKCGSLFDARKVFDRMSHHDTVSWSLLVLACAQNGEAELGCQLFTFMQSARCVPTAFTFVSALKACTALALEHEGSVNSEKPRALERGREIHAQVTEASCDSDTLVVSCLIDMYSKCGSLEDALAVFERSSHPEVVVWNAILLACVENREGEMGLGLFQRMQDERMKPNAHTFIAAFKACSVLAGKEEGRKVDGRLLKPDALERGARVHNIASESGVLSEMQVASSLVDMYARCGEMSEARAVFDAIRSRDIVVWTSLLLGYTQSGKPELALHLYEQMKAEGCFPDFRCYVTLLKTCAHLADKDESRKQALEQGVIIGSQARKAGFGSDFGFDSTLIELFSKCGSMERAERVFRELSSPADSTTWTWLIHGYAQTGENAKALGQFARMQLEGCSPVAQTYVAVLKACSGLAEKEERFKQVDGHLLKVRSLRRIKPIHSRAAESGFVSDVYITSALVDLYSKCGSMSDAVDVFSGTPAAVSNVVCWTALILGYSQNTMSEQAVRMFGEMQARTDCQPDAHTYAAVLKACSDSASVEVGRDIHGLVLRHGMDTDPVVANALVDLYAKCGKTLQAQQEFDSTPAAKGIEIWSGLLGAYTRQGDTVRAFELVSRLEEEEAGVRPDGITFTYILSACSHAGLVDKGKRWFQEMKSRYGVTPELEHYHGLVDLLGRANRLEEALEVIRTMPWKANSVTWMTLLSACRKWKDIETGKVAYESLIKIDEKHVQGYVLMANMYSESLQTSFP